MADSALPGQAGEAMASNHATALDTLRACKAHEISPVRFHLAESMARRAAGYEGAARCLLDARLATLIRALTIEIGQGQATPGVVHATARQCVPERSALAGLVEHIARHKPPMSDALSAAAPGVPAPGGSATDPHMLQFFRRTWSRLSAHQRLAQSRSTLPENAGPLNSHHLVHRALTAMRELSPEYFEHFIGHVDALLWLERSHEQAAKDAGLPPRARGARKSGAGRRA